MFIKGISFDGYQQKNDIYWAKFWQNWRLLNYSEVVVDGK